MRRACLLAGLALLGLVWFGPLLTAWRESFAAHMVAHMGVVALAAPLISIGLVGGEKLGSQAVRPSSPLFRGRGVTRSVTERRSFLLLSAPLLASLLELLAVWGWHAPAARAWAEASLLATVLEQASFLGAGLFLWTSALRPGHEAAGAFGLLLTTVHMTLLGALIALSPRPLYGAGEVTCFGTVLSAAEDQQLGGVAMLLVGAAVYLAGGVALLGRLLGADPATIPSGTEVPR